VSVARADSLFMVQRAQFTHPCCGNMIVKSQTGFLKDIVTALDALAHATLFNVFDASSGYKADLFIRKDRPFSIEEFKRRKSVDVLGLPLYLVASEDAILSKLEWAKKSQSERQFTDALGVAIVQAETLDWKYMQSWARILELDEYYQLLVEESSKYR